MIWFFIIFTLLVISARIYGGAKPKAASNDAAIVMATGIIISGALQKFPALASSVGAYATIALLSLLLWLAAEYIRDLFYGSFYQRHLSDAIQSFALGTWVAALSVTVVSLTVELPAFRPIAVFLFILAVVLNCAFVFLVILNYYRISANTSCLKEVKGVILLGCVANQSIVTAGSNLYDGSFPIAASLFLICLGTLFYVLGFIALVVSYKGKRFQNLVENWPNTNTLLHGSISITGLAIVSSQLNAPNIAAAIWLTSFSLLIAVEGIDILRALKRLRNLGLRKGLFVYQPSQWSRIFTLGMFLAFSIKLPMKSSFLKENSWAALVHQVIIGIGPYLIVILFFIEVLLALSHLFSMQSSDGAPKSNQ